MRRLLLALLIVLPAARASADASLQERFQEANGHYWKQRYGAARDGYLDLVQRFGVQDPVVWYNLGDAYYQLGQLGRAVLSFKRALTLEPHEALATLAHDNLERTQEALIDRHRKDVSKPVAVLDESHGVAWGLFHLVSARTAGLVFAGLWVLLLGALAARHLASEPRRAALRTAAIVLAVPTLLAGTAWAGNLVTSDSIVRAIVVEDHVRMRDGRHPDAPTSDVPEGLEVQILDDTDPAEVRIRLSNGKEGWVPAKAVEAI